MSARTRSAWDGLKDDPILWGALGCALVGTANAEYTLATAAHFNEYVAVVVPGALDLYVVRALQHRRDVFVSVLAMVGANVASHLIGAGMLNVGWQVISAVGAIPPLIVWRVYSLRGTRTRQELLWGLEAGAVSAPAPEAETAPRSAPECTCGRTRRALARLGWSRYACECTAPEPEHAECGAPDYVPESWSGADAVPYLHLVQDPAPESAPGAAECSAPSAPLLPGDMEYLAQVQKYIDTEPRPSVRGLRKQISVGQERAKRLLAHLGGTS